MRARVAAVGAVFCVTPLLQVGPGAADARDAADAIRAGTPEIVPSLDAAAEVLRLVGATDAEVTVAIELARRRNRSA